LNRPLGRQIPGLSGLITGAWFAMSAALAVEMPSGIDGPAATPAAERGTNPATASPLLRRAAEMRRQAFETTYRAGATVTAHAASGACSPLAVRRAGRYQEVLGSASSVAARADAALAVNPGKAATLWVQAEKIARGVVSGAAAVDCVVAQ
jgi:hypothetical protein